MRRSVTPRPRLLASLRLLPWPERCFVAWVLLATLAPVAVLLAAEIAGSTGSSLLTGAARHPLLLMFGSAAACVFALLVLEPPASASLRAYLAQVRQRLSRSQSHHDAAMRRHFPEESHDEARHP